MTAAAHSGATPRQGSAESIADQVRRVISVLAWFHTHPDASLMATADHFGISVPQLREELTQVQECGLPTMLPGSLVELDINGTQVEIRESLGLDHALALTSAEVGALELNLEKLSSILADDERADADGAAARIRALATHPQAGGTPAGEEIPEGPASADAPTLTLLRQAIASPRHWVQFSYLSVSSDSLTLRKVVPDHVGIVNGAGYLWGREGTEEGLKEQRRYLISRMSAVEILSRPAPDASPPEITAEDPFGFRETTDDWAELTLTEDAMWMLEYLPVWHIETTRVEIPDTGAWLERFLLAYAPEITSVTPALVAARAAQRCSAALAAYRSLA